MHYDGQLVCLLYSAVIWSIGPWWTGIIVWAQNVQLIDTAETLCVSDFESFYLNIHSSLSVTEVM